MFKLIIEDDEGKTTVVPLIRDEITIGRKEGNTIRLTERNVSRRHAKLLRSNGAIFIEDLESYTGTRVNGARIAGKVPVREGDRIEIGDYHLALKLDKSSEAGATTTQVDNKDTIRVVDGASALEDQATVRIVAGPATTTASGNFNDTVRTAAPPEPHGPSVQAPPQPARLVVISQQLGGLDFKLDKAAMVIGRTDENDVVLNHRSISRHHAKIIYEGGRYQIVDLESSNGVRVNGEDYGRVELCRGDIIELGHVRLRFVEAGEDYRFDPATAIDTTAGSRRGMVAATMLVLLLLGLAAGIAYRRGLFAPQGTQGVVASTGADAGPVASATPQPGSEPPAVALPSDAAGSAAAEPQAEVDALLAEAGKAVSSRDWSQALGLYDRVLEKQPRHPAATQARARVKEEQQHATTYDKLKQAAERKEWDRALKLLQSISPKSVYRLDAKDLGDKVVAGYLARHRELALRALRDKKHEVARHEAEAMLKVSPDDPDAQAVLKKIEDAERAKAARAAAPQPTKQDRRERQRARAPAQQAAVPKLSPEELQKAAQGAYLGGNYSEAARLATQLARSRPAFAWRLATMAQCKQKSGAAVRSFGRFVRAASSSSEFEQTKALLKSVCSANGISLP